VLTATPAGVEPAGVVPDAAPDFAVCTDVDVEGCAEPEVPDEDSSAGESVVDDADWELGSGVSADATPWPLATATPTPKATANAPTRPTYAAAPIIAPTESPDIDLTL
jgi:hypothetical protein